MLLHWLDTVGKLLSDSVVSESADPVIISNIAELKTHDWTINPDSKMLYHRQDSQIRFYYNGQVIELPYTDTRLDFVQKLCANTDICLDSNNKWQNDEALTQLFLAMINSEAILPIE